MKPSTAPRLIAITMQELLQEGNDKHVRINNIFEPLPRNLNKNVVYWLMESFRLNPPYHQQYLSRNVLSMTTELNSNPFHDPVRLQL